jgi:putative ABC transport system permease protein
MIRNFFKIAFRNLWKNKLFSVIKIAGLGIALATCLLVGLFLHHELSYDAFHDNADRIVRTSVEYRFNGEVRQTQTTGN